MKTVNACLVVSVTTISSSLVAHYDIFIHEVICILLTFVQAYMERVQQSSSKDKNRKTELRQLQEELLALKMNEARAVADLEVAKQKISELETQVTPFFFLYKI